jgi:tetratricopeptide (TPR) repeat protein
MKLNKKKLIISLVMIHSLTSGLAFANVKPQSSHNELVLNHLMQAELAASRNLYKEALVNYLIVAELTKNPEIAAIATEYALELQDAQAAIRAVVLWAENDLTNVEAQLIALSLLIDTNIEQSRNFLQTTFNSHEDDLEEHLVSILYKISDTGRSNLTALSKEIAHKEPNNAQVQLCTASLLANQLMINEAKPYLAQSLKNSKDYSGALRLQAKVIRFETGSDSKALEYLKAQVDRLPNDFALREFYTSALVDNGSNQEAVEQLKILSQNKEHGADAAIQLGEFYLTNNNYKDAKVYFNKALNDDNTKDLAQYNLGQVAEHQQDIKQATDWYLKIDEESEHRTNGFLRAAFLQASVKEYENALEILQNSNPRTFVEQKQVILTQIDLLIDLKNFEEADNTATQVLAVVPNDVDFLYSRSVVRNHLKQYQPAEEDLRLLIQIEPQHANALNALACTLSQQPHKVEQAMIYIDQALSIAPNNPAFMDSKGWLLFKKGEIKQSLIILHQAYELSQEAIIAIHYGEALWATGKTKDAKLVWAKALKNDPQIEELHLVLNKYKLTLKDL